MNKKIKAVFTICSKNYVHYAATMLQSVKCSNSDVDLYLVIVDRKELVDFSDLHINVIWVEDLGITNFEQIAFKYNILELNTNVKPTVFKTILKQYQKVIYLDPDIYVYNSLSEIFTNLIDNDIVLTPHMLQPQFVHKHERNDIVSEVENLKTGGYNLGFIGLSNGEEASKFLDWWENCCLCCAFDEHESGVFVDQKWLSLVTCYFERVKILRHSGLNVAYWNIHERELLINNDSQVLVNNQELIFFHFSGHSYVDGECNRLSKHLLGFTVENGSVLQSLLLNYNVSVATNKELLQRFKTINYGFANYSNGELIEDLARRVYAKYLTSFKDNPFNVNNNFYKFAKKNLLTSNEMNASKKADVVQLKLSKKVHVLEVVMHLVHRLLGVKKFTLILRFLRHYSITTNYAKIFKNKI